MSSIMISRYYLQGPESRPIARRNKPVSLSGGRRSYFSGWLILVLLTSAYVFWLAYRWGSRPIWMTHFPTAVYETISLIEMAAAITLIFVWAGLFWQNRLHRRRLSRSLAMTKEQLFELDPKSFEHYVAGLFRQKAYAVTVRGRSGDHGVDLELKSARDKRAIVQCKRYRGTVGEKIVRDLFGTLLHERASRAFLVTTADISDAAAKWSQGKPITLIDGDTLVEIAASLNQQRHN
jgi:restriction system protein